MEIKLWRIYLTNVPYWNIKSQSYIHKPKSVLVYDLSCGDAIVLSLTSNENVDGSIKRKAALSEFAIKTNKHRLIKLTKQIKINKESL